MPRRPPWRFIALAILFLILLGWGLAPGDQRRRFLESVPAYLHHPPPTNLDSPLAPPPTSIPLTFETDPEPSKTAHCTAPYNPDTPLVQWALMLDAGSTGSRIHIYKFNNCKSAPAYEYEVFLTTQPGLSALASNPTTAARSLDVLLDAALTTVPKSLHKCTPVAVKATAGLRMLGPEQSAAIMTAVRIRLTFQYPFPIVGKDGVAIMDGRDEGVYAWITANYLLDTLHDFPSPAAAPLAPAPPPPSPGAALAPAPPPPYAVLDLGGASTQIVFEPSTPLPADSPHKYTLADYSNRILYQHSYLGYGLMRARERVHRLVHFLHEPESQPPSQSPSEEIPNPCLSRGSKRSVHIIGSGGQNTTATMIGADIGAFHACMRIVDLVLAKDSLCPLKPCSFAGTYHPPLPEITPVLLLSYFYDRLDPLLPPGTDILSLGQLGALAARICLGREGWADRPLDLRPHDGHWTPADAEWAYGLHFSESALTELEGRPEYCLDLVYMHALLRGYGLPTARALRIAKKAKGTEMGWCLGAVIGVVGQAVAEGEVGECEV